MGLLSEPEVGGGWWTGAAVRWGRAAGLAAWLLGAAWLALLSLPALHTHTHFSENALLPGLVRSDVTRDGVAARIYSELLTEMNDKYSEREESPVPWLVGKMTQLGLETYTHNFTLHYKLARSKMYHGTNVYGVMRAARSSSLEALVVSAPYRALSSLNKGTAAGIALLLDFARRARGQRYWAKDLVFVVTEYEQLGMQAWLEAYHGDARAHAERGWADSLEALLPGGAGGERWSAAGAWLEAGRLPARSGAIQAAIHLEIHAPDIKYVEVKPDGLNGQLSNLDLVNLAHRMCKKARVPHAYRGSVSWQAGAAGADLRTLAAHVLQRAPGAPSAAHGLFHRYGIEAVTLEGRDASGEPRAAALPALAFPALAVVLEGTLRSLNNLLERFHQSYFFYLLLHIDRFASIGQYMPSLCLPVGALLVRALSLWLQGGGAGGGWGGAALQCAWKHAAGGLLAVAPLALSRLGAAHPLQLSTEFAVYWGLVAMCLMLAASDVVQRPRAELLAPALLELATAFLTIGLHNAPLGILLAVIYTPLALQVEPAPVSRFRRRATQVACVLLHPLVLLTLVLSGYSMLIFPEESLAAAVTRGVRASQQAIIFAVIDSHVYGNWVWSVCCFVLMPVWSVLWQTAFASVKIRSSCSKSPTS